jgi:hypothetical protein
MVDVNIRDFFVSFTQDDEQWAKWIAYIVEEAGYSVWFQAWDFRANWVSRMQQAATGSRRTIVVLSDAYLRSGPATAEWTAGFAQDAASKNDKLVPIKIDSVKVEDLGLFSSIIYADLTNCEEEAAAKKLLQRIQMAVDPAYRPKPSVRPEFPLKRPRVIGTKPSYPPDSSTLRPDDDAGATFTPVNQVNSKVRNALASAGIEPARTLDQLISAARKALAGNVVFCEEIHVGDYSQVIRGESFGKPVAVKILSKNTQIDKIASAVEQALAHARDQSKKYPSLTEIWWFNWNSGPRYIVMDYIDWPTVDAWRRNLPDVRLPATKAAKIVSLVGYAQAAAHERGLPLGPLSPQDVFVHINAGEPVAIRISPFRMGALLPALLGISEGLPLRWSYLNQLPPEMYEGHLPSQEEYDRSGQFYLGMLGLELFRGSKPVAVRSLADLSRMEKFYLSPRTLFSEADDPDPWTKRHPALVYVISRLLERKPSLRYHNSTQAAEDLGEIAEGRLPDTIKNEIQDDYPRIASPAFAERFYSRLFGSKDGQALKALFSNDLTKQHMKFAEMLIDIQLYEPNAKWSRFAVSLKKHANYHLTDGLVDTFRTAMVDEIETTFPGVPQKRNAWDAVLHHALIGLKREIAAGTPQTSVVSG